MASMRVTVSTLGLVVALSMLASAQSGSAPTTASGARRYVVIGCLSREGTAAAPRFVLTDPRGDRPTVYRLTGDAALLAPHVGHTVEAAGSITTPAAPGRGTPSSPTLKVDSLVWLSTACAGKK